MNEQAIPSKKKIPISLVQTIATKFTPETLRPQLGDAGLPCADTASDAELQDFIDRGVEQFKAILAGQIGLKAYEFSEFIDNDQNLASAKFYGKAIKTHVIKLASGGYHELRLMQDEQIEVDYKVSESALGWKNELYTVLQSDNFAYLEEKSKEDPSKYVFTGERGGPDESNKKVKTDDAIISLFSESAATAAQIYPASGGVNESSMEAAMSKTIGKNINGLQADDYASNGNKNLLLVDHYDEKTEDARGIGAINISWTMEIKEYKHKEKDGGDEHEVFIKMWARGMFYDDICVLCTDYKMITGEDPCPANGIPCTNN